MRVEVADGRGEAPTRFSRETSCRSDPAVRLSPFRPPKGRVGRNIVLFQKQTGRFLERNVTVCDSRFLTHCLHFPQTPHSPRAPFVWCQVVARPCRKRAQKGRPTKKRVAFGFGINKRPTDLGVKTTATLSKFSAPTAFGLQLARRPSAFQIESRVVGRRRTHLFRVFDLRAEVRGLRPAPYVPYPVRLACARAGHRRRETLS